MVTPNVVSSINYGLKHKKDNITYPIRKEINTIKERKDKASKVKYLLETTNLTKKEIASIVSFDPSTVSRINSGILYKDENRTYPIRR